MQIPSEGGGTARQVASAAMDGGSPTGALAADVLAVRQATARFATGLEAAKAAGYRIITPMMPNMGYHYMNPNVTGFNVRRPPILVYEYGPGARYGTFPAACHYVHGTFVPAASQADCASRNPKTGARFEFWHPRLTLHLWARYPNPAGIYHSTDPLVAPLHHG